MRGAFTCVGWQVALCDPIWQVTSRSCEPAIQTFNLLTFTATTIKLGHTCYDANVSGYSVLGPTVSLT